MWCEVGKNLEAREKRREGSPVARRASLSLAFRLHLSLLQKPESQRRSRLGARGPSGGLTGCWAQERGSDASHPPPPAAFPLPGHQRGSRQDAAGGVC